MTQLTSSTASIGKIQPFTIAYAKYVIQQEHSETGTIDPASIRVKMFKLYDYFFEYEWQQVWLAIQEVQRKNAKAKDGNAIAPSSKGLVVSSKQITSSFVRSSMKSQPWSFYSSRRHTHSGLNSNGLDLKEFRDSLIYQALATLGLSKDIEFKAAQKAYRLLMRDNHPDKFSSFGDPKITADKEAYCTTINAAWEFVKDWLPQE